ncbi:MAG: hypothetical protein ACKO3W_07995 [bacterium]
MDHTTHPIGSHRRIASITAAAFGGALVGLFASSFGVDRADAGPPAPSALSIQQNAASSDAQDALDAGRQRLDVVNELRALRTEVAELKSLLTSGRVRANIGNFADMPLDKMRLEIDYDRLRDAMKGN